VNSDFLRWRWLGYQVEGGLFFLLTRRAALELRNPVGMVEITARTVAGAEAAL
jgi:hypothetical protein